MKTDKIIDIVILLVVLFAGYKAAKIFGLIEDTEGARAEAGFSGNSNFLPYKIIYSTVSLQQLIEGLKPSKQVVLLTQFAVKNYEGLITQLLGAKKLINDDETAVYSVFRSIGSLEELAYFVEQWEKYIDENEEVLSSNIEAELAEKARVEIEAEQKKAELEKEAKAAELKVDAPPAEPAEKKEEKKEGSAFGWIVAGVAAAVGLGFLFKNKG